MSKHCVIGKQSVLIAATFLLGGASTLISAPPDAESSAPMSHSPPQPAARRSEYVVRTNAVPVLRRYADSFALNGRKERIQDRFITDERRWSEVWQILHGRMEHPDVDFAKEIVLVGAFGDGNSYSIETDLDERGSLRVGCMGTLRHESNPTHGSYILHVVSREGIKSINNKPLPTGIWRTTAGPELKLE